MNETRDKFTQLIKYMTQHNFLGNYHEFVGVVITSHFSCVLMRHTDQTMTSFGSTQAQSSYDHLKSLHYWDTTKL